MRFLRVPMAVWGVGCLLVGIIYLVVWPAPPAAVPTLAPWHVFVLRWFHGVLWLVLAVSCWVRPVPQLGGRRMANGLAAIAGLMYVIFLIAVALRG